MTNLSSLVSLASTLLEVTQFAGDLMLLALGCSALARLAELLHKLAKVLTWLAELILLAIALVLSALGDVAPIVGHQAGRAAGTAYRLGCQARRFYDAHFQPTVNALVLHLDQTSRAFVLEQLGTAYPAVSKAIAPSVESIALVASSSPVEQFQPIVEPSSPMTRRQLLQLAKAQGLPRYSRMTTAQLREAIAA